LSQNTDAILSDSFPSVRRALGLKQYFNKRPILCTTFCITHPRCCW